MSRRSLTPTCSAAISTFGKQTAARRFVAGVLRKILADLLDLSEQDATAYGHVEAAVRQHYKVLDYDVLALEDAVRAAASDEPHRVAVAMALSKLTEAHAEDLTAKQQTAFLIGIEVGRALRRPDTGKVGSR